MTVEQHIAVFEKHDYSRSWICQALRCTPAELDRAAKLNLVLWRYALAGLWWEVGSQSC